MKKTESSQNWTLKNDTLMAHLMAKADPPICQTYGTTLTIKHIFGECRQYEKQKEELNISQ